jgi:hypothetical protein
MNGESDKMVPTKNTVDLDRRLPNSQLVLYPDGVVTRPDPRRVCGPLSARFNVDPRTAPGNGLLPPVEQ